MEKERVCKNLSDYVSANFFMCACQKPIVRDAWQEYEPIVRELNDALMNMPPLYAQENEGYKAKVYAHYFGGATDVFVTECSGGDAFGYVILNGDYDNSEMGYVSIEEITSIDALNLDFYWEVCSLSEALMQVDEEYFSNM